MGPPGLPEIRRPQAGVFLVSAEFNSSATVVKIGSWSAAANWDFKTMLCVHPLFPLALKSAVGVVVGQLRYYLQIHESSKRNL